MSVLLWFVVDYIYFNIATYVRPMLDGFDILGNLSNVTRSLTAQGRVEQYTNVMPRYAMLHLVYRLNIAPKKKK